MLKFTLKPYDVLFFGSGKPFNRGDVVNSSFPPHPNTLASAIYSKLYHSNMIDESIVNNPNVINAVYGPFIQKGEKIYFPKPHNIYGKRKQKDLEKVFIINIPEEKTSENGTSEKKFKLFDPSNTNKPEEIESLPVYIGNEEVEPFNGFISTEGLRKYFNGGEIDAKSDILLYEGNSEQKSIFKRESRIGISVDSSSNSVNSEDALFRVEFLRFLEDVKLVFWVDFNLSGGIRNINEYQKLVEFFNKNPKSLKLGGEMRNVGYEVQEDDFNKIFDDLGLSRSITVEPSNSLKVVFLTYGVFDGPIGMIKIDEFKTLSSCFNGYDFIGINLKRTKQRKIKRALPPGSVIWLKSTTEKTLNSINNPTFIVGRGRDYKFGFPEGKQEFIGTNLVLLKEVEYV
jgi:CRISPR-associated protein Cmr3